MSQVATLLPGREASEIMESVIVKGDLSKLSPEERSRYYGEVCRSVGLNPLTKPFEYITLNGKLTLYALRNCTDQLRQIHKVSVIDMSEAERDGIVIVTCKVSNGEGRTDMAKGAVALGGLKGEALCNAIMKAECVPLNSEILTRDGFKKHDEISIGEEVLAYDCGADRCLWTPLLAVRVFPAAPVVRLQSTKGQFSVLCTEDHAWAARTAPYKARSDRPRGPYKNRQAARQLVKTRDINTSQSIILAAPECEERESLLSPVEAAILGWAVTDGTIQRRGSYVRVGVCQSKEENFAAIREIVGDVKELVTPARSRTFPMSGRTYETKPQHWWYLPSAVGRSLLAKAGYTARCDLPRIVTRLSATARAAMLQAMMLAEGDARGTFANTDPFIVEAFDILCALQGTATGALKERGTVHTKRLKKTRHVAGSFLSWSSAEATDVWCPTTAFGTWDMRQNGRVMITGNTKAKRRATLSICGLGWLDETEIEAIPNGRPAQQVSAPTPAELAPPPEQSPEDLETFMIRAVEGLDNVVKINEWAIRHKAAFARLSSAAQDRVKAAADRRRGFLVQAPPADAATIHHDPETGEMFDDESEASR